MKHQDMKQMSSEDDFNCVKRGEKIIGMLKEQRKDELEAKEHKCLHKILNRKTFHEEVC